MKQNPESRLMETAYELKVADVARIANCHRLTVIAYERRGILKPTRNIQNHRRFSSEDAQKLKALLALRQLVDE
jgi:DNA-binding transcriptional MerR regulator